MQQQAKIRVHSMSLNDWRDIPGMENYEGRVLIASGPQDTVFLSKMPSKVYLKYREENLGMTNKEIRVVKGTGNNLAEKLISDEENVKFIRENFPKETILDTFIVSPIEESLAKKIGLKILGNSKTAMTLGSKSGFRHAAKESQVTVPDGFEDLCSLAEVRDALLKIFETYEKAVIKGDHGASSIQNIVISRSKDWEKKLTLAIESIKFPVVVEGWIEEIYSSPSVHFYINGNGNIRSFMGPWEQSLNGENRAYCGTTYPASLPESLKERLWENGWRLARYYQKAGYVGHFGFDFIVTADNRVIGVECNARKGGVYYPRKFADFQGLNEDYIIYARDLKSEKLQGIDFENVLKNFADILYSQSKKTGVVFYNEGLLEIGKIQTIIVDKVDKSKDLADNYYWKELNRRLSD